MESPYVPDKKKSHGVQLLIRTVVTDQKGKVISDSGQKPSKSFVIGFLEYIYAIFRVTPAAFDITDINNSEETAYYNNDDARWCLRMSARINIDTHGIVVGTGDTGETNTDYKLETQLTEGVGAGNITHGAQAIETTAVVGANVDMECKRSFPNNTGSTITIKEAGMYAQTYEAPAGPYLSFCIVRDVLGVPVVLPDNCGLTVYYTLRTTV